MIVDTLTFFMITGMPIKRIDRTEVVSVALLVHTAFFFRHENLRVIHSAARQWLFYTTKKRVVNS